MVIFTIVVILINYHERSFYILIYSSVNFFNVFTILSYKYFLSCLELPCWILYYLKVFWMILISWILSQSICHSYMRGWAFCEFYFQLLYFISCVDFPSGILSGHLGIQSYCLRIKILSSFSFTMCIFLFSPSVFLLL